MNIFTTDMVNPECDVFWNDIAAIIPQAATKPVLILVHETDNTLQAVLMKMLSACRLTPDSYNLLTLKEGQQIAWHRLREQLNPRIVFLIGIYPAQLGISVSFRLHEPNNFDSRTWLPTLPLSDLEQHPEAKKQLWQNGMKPVFVDSAAQ